MCKKILEQQTICVICGDWNTNLHKMQMHSGDTLIVVNWCVWKEKWRKAFCGVQHCWLVVTLHPLPSLLITSCTYTHASLNSTSTSSHFPSASCSLHTFLNIFLVFNSYKSSLIEYILREGTEPGPTDDTGVIQLWQVGIIPRFKI